MTAAKKPPISDSEYLPEIELAVLPLTKTGWPDADAAFSFLKSNPHIDVLNRNRQQALHRLISRFSVAVTQDERIVGCSIAYLYSTEENSFIEIGSMRVILNSLRLQSLMMQMQLAMIAACEQDRTTVFSVVRPNSASEHSLGKRVGMEIWTLPEHVVQDRCADGLPVPDDKRTFRATQKTFGAAFEMLAAYGITKVQLRDGARFPIRISKSLPI